MVETTTRPRRQSFQNKKHNKEVRFGSYVLGSTLGEGEFGKVKLGWKKDSSNPSQVAIKFIKRESIPRGSERESKVHREINALKRLSHPNIITLEEVLQNDKYIGIVLEYASGGELFDYILQHRYLKDSLGCRLFAQLVSGVHYMHSKGIVHRDLKLENLLLDKHKNIVITDFGFVNSFTASNEFMKTSCGSPCYAAPELVISSEPYEARKADIWSCGVILYAILAGYLPFDDDPQNPDGDDISRLYQYITNTHLTFPEYVEPMPRDLLRRILVSNPKKRIDLKDIRNHPWLAPHAPFLSVTPSEWDSNHRNNAVTTTSSPNLLNTQQRPSTALKNDYRRFSLIDTSTVSTGTFYSHPLPPQTSSNHAIAFPSPSSSIPLESDRNSSSRGHRRSNSVQSTASLALQAVVDADEVRYHQQATLPSSVSAYSVDKGSSFVSSGSFSSENKRTSDKIPHLFPAVLPRSTTHTGIADLNTTKLGHYSVAANAIHETPETADLYNQGFVQPRIPIASNPIPTQKLPGPSGRKQRPTSYHPGLYSMSSTEQGSSDYHFGQPMFTKSDSSTSIASLGNRISKPFVDLSLAEGDIIIPKSPTLLNAKVYNDKSSEKLQETSLQDLKKSITTINESLEKSQQSSNVITNEDTKKQNRLSAVLAAELVIDKIYSTQEPLQGKSREALGMTSNSIDINPNSSTRINSRGSTNQPPQRTTSKSKPRPMSIAVTSSRPNNSNSASNKSKRFSFLSFYSFSNDNNSTTEVESTKSTKSKSDTIVGTTTIEPNTKTTTPVKPLKKKVLESSNGANISVDNKITPLTYTSFAPKKEPSTAKKVMDFFKRRSMRV